MPDDTKKRVQKKRKTKEEIENLIVSFYKEKQDNPSIEDIFYRWMNERMEYFEIENSTYTRYVIDFKRCFSEFGKRKIKYVNELDIEKFLKETIREKQMSKKAFYNIRTLMYGIFKYAKKHGFVNYSIYGVIKEIQFTKKEFNHNSRSNEEQVFSSGEEKKIVSYLEENLDGVNLGLLLLFKTGLRIGELCTLKHSDIHECKILVRRTETFFKDTTTGEYIYEVRDSAKTEAGIRDVIVKKECTWILDAIQKLSPSTEYVFTRDGKRMSSYVFRNRLYNICDRLDIDRKSPHNIRKTYGTKMYDSDIPKSIMCKQMGHTDVSYLEKYYCFNRHESEEINTIINDASEL